MRTFLFTSTNQYIGEGLPIYGPDDLRHYQQLTDERAVISAQRGGEIIPVRLSGSSGPPELVTPPGEAEPIEARIFYGQEVPL